MVFTDQLFVHRGAATVNADDRYTVSAKDGQQLGYTYQVPG
jgi:hypothetical protein